MSCTWEHFEFALTSVVIKELDAKHYLTGINIIREGRGNGRHVPRDPEVRVYRCTAQELAQYARGISLGIA